MLRHADEPTPATILAVDDDGSVRRALALLLRSRGFDVWEAATAEQALRLASRRPSLVILDVVLPDASGLAVCRRIKDDPDTADVPVLMVSGVAVRPGERAEGLDEGADAYLTKPVEPEELVAYVRTLLRVRRAEAKARAAQQEAEAQRRRVATILESIGDAFLSVDRGWRVVYANDRALRLVNRSREDFLGREVWEALPPVLRQAFSGPLRRAAAEGVTVTFDAHHPDGVWLEAHAYPSEE